MMPNRFEEIIYDSHHEVPTIQALRYCGFFPTAGNPSGEPVPCYVRGTIEDIEHNRFFCIMSPFNGDMDRLDIGLQLLLRDSPDEPTEFADLSTMQTTEVVGYLLQYMPRLIPPLSTDNPGKHGILYRKLNATGPSSRRAAPF